MLFNSIDFLTFFPIVAIIFFIIPRKLRALWTLIASYYFYMSWNPKYAVLIAVSTIITFISGFLMEKKVGEGVKHGKEFVVAVSLVSNLAILGIFKNADFADKNTLTNKSMRQLLASLPEEDPTYYH